MRIRPDEIRHRAEDLGWSMRSLSRRSGVSNIQRVLKRASASPETVYALAQTLGCTVSDLADRPRLPLVADRVHRDID